MSELCLTEPENRCHKKLTEHIQLMLNFH